MDAMEAYIPYQLRAKLQQIAPVLDLDWQHQRGGPTCLNN